MDSSLKIWNRFQISRKGLGRRKRIRNRLVLKERQKIVSKWRGSVSWPSELLWNNNCLETGEIFTISVNQIQYNLSKNVDKLDICELGLYIQCTAPSQEPKKNSTSKWITVDHNKREYKSQNKLSDNE